MAHIYSCILLSIFWLSNSHEKCFRVMPIPTLQNNPIKIYIPKDYRKKDYSVRNQHIFSGVTHFSIQYLIGFHKSFELLF